MPAREVSLPPSIHARLTGCLRLLRSPEPGEVAAAAAGFHRILDARGLDVEAVLAPPAVPALNGRPRPEPAPQPEDDLTFLGRHFLRLSPWETEFALSLSQWRGPASDRQRAVLARIARRLRSEGAA